MPAEKTHILLTGGGTLGPVTPLLAIAEVWRRRDPDVQVSWLGTPKGPERMLVEQAKIYFYALRAPKLDRARPWKLVFAPFLFALACVRAFSLLRELEPSIVFSAGAYVSVPVAWMAWVLRIPVWVHQLDVPPGLSNKLMAPIARRISVTWEESAAVFPARKVMVVGGMVRHVLTMGDKSVAYDRYGFDPAKPFVFIMGGGTGASWLNETLAIIGKELASHANVLHLTGRGKLLTSLSEIAPNYVPLEFLGEGIADAYAAADVVVVRAGMGTLMELVALGKASVLVPIANSDQVANAAALKERRAAEVLDYVTPQTLLQAIDRLLESPDRRAELSSNIRTAFPLNAAERIVHEAMEMVEIPAVSVENKIV